jgi:hypothetical protein
MKQMPVESFFFAFGSAVFRRSCALRSWDFAQREQGLRQLRLVQTVQEVALILGVRRRFEQLELGRPAAVLAHARVVAGGDQVGAQVHGVVEESLELDFGVAQHVRDSACGRPGIRAGIRRTRGPCIRLAKLTASMSTPTTSATLAASIQSCRVEQYSESSSSSQFFMNRPITS